LRGHALVQAPAAQAAEAAEVTVTEDSSLAQQIGWGLLGSVLLSVWLVYGPLFAIGEGAYEAHLNSAFKSASEQVLIALPLPEEVVHKAVGSGSTRGSMS
jgi:hypothetical protein